MSRHRQHGTPCPAACHALPPQQVYLAKGSEDWQPAVAAAVLRQLPALQRLQFRFSFDDEQTPQVGACPAVQVATARRRQSFIH